MESFTWTTANTGTELFPRTAILQKSLIPGYV